MEKQNDDVPAAMQTLARHQMITRLYADILVDMQVCEIEGWDKMEYLKMLKGIINHFIRHG